MKNGKLILMTLIALISFSALWSQANGKSDFKSSNAQAPVAKQIIGYFPSWQMYKRNNLVNPAMLDYSRYTILNYSFFKTDTNGNVGGTDAWADSMLLRGIPDWGRPQPAYYPNTSLIDHAHLHGVKVMVSIGGWTLSDNFSRIAEDPIKRAHFAHECARILQEYQFDGIDIDWEYPTFAEHSGRAIDRETYPVFMKAIRDSIDAYGKTINTKMLLTGAYGTGEKQMAAIKWDVMKEFMDYFNMMTYDSNGPWSDDANHNSPLYNPSKGYQGSMDQTFKNITQKYHVPAEKVNLGIALYGRALRGFNGTEPVALFRNDHQHKVDDVIFAEHEGMPQYYNIMEEAGKHGYKEYWDDVSKVPYLISQEEQSFVSYDNPRSVKLKAEYVVANKCAGVIMWDSYGDYMETKPGSGFVAGTPLVDELVNTFGTDKLPRPRIKKIWY